MFERRRQKRIKDDIIVMFDAGEKGFVEEETRCLNLSLGGMQIATAYPVTNNQKLRCNLGVMSDAIPLEIEARVASIKESTGAQKRKEYIVGLEFVFTDQLMRDRLQDYIKRRLSQAGNKHSD